MIQIDMEMPKSCLQCPICHCMEGKNVPWNYYCSATMDDINIEEWDRERYITCPLKEVNEVEADDCISRLEVLKVLAENIGRTNTYIQTEVLDLPPVHSKSDKPNGKWIPVKCRPLTEEDLEEFGHEYSEMWDCTLPDESCTVLITYVYRDQKYVTYTEFDFDDKYFDEYNDEVIAWMPLPEPYEPQESEDNNTSCQG